MLRRHLQILVHIAQCLDELTRLGLTRRYDRATLAATVPTGPRVETQLDILLLLAVAFEAALHEQRANLRLEEGNPVCLGSLRHRAKEQRRSEDGEGMLHETVTR